MECFALTGRLLSQKVVRKQKSYFVFNSGRKKMSEYNKFHISDIAKISAGGDKPSVCSPRRTPLTPIPIFSNGMEKEGLYGYTDRAKIHEKAITVTARGANIGTVHYRTEPYYPIVRLISVLPNTDIVDPQYLYYYLKGIHINGTGSAQPQITVPYFSKTIVEILSDKEKQKRIAEILAALDNKIDINNQINKNLVA